MKPPLTYFGGKQKLSHIILSHIPKHNLYCEPFFGGGAIYFAKNPSEIEVINDTNGDLINFYRIAKMKFRKLQREIKATLYSREHHQTAKIILEYPKLFNEVKRAWAIWMLANASHASRLDSPFGFDRKKNTSAKRMRRKRDRFTDDYAKRMEETEIENADALKVIATRDSKKSFFYLDPPYFNASMGHYGKYTEKDFVNLLEVLSTIKGKFLLSSYPSDLLQKHIRKNKWHTKKIEMQLDLTTRFNSQQKKTELLTANYPLK